MKKLFVLGLDGVTWDFLCPLMDKKKLPNLSRLYENSNKYKLKSVVPPYTYSAWKSYSSGENVDSLNVFYWYDLDALKKGHVKINDSRSIKQNEIWDYLSKKGIKCCVMGMPMTFPPKKINGYMISGYPALDHMNYTYPSFLKKILQDNYDYKILNEYDLSNVNSDLEYKVKAVEELTYKTNLDFKIAKNLWFSENLDFMHLTIFHTDSMLHYMWRDVIDESSLLYDACIAFWKTIDNIIGEIYDMMKNDYFIIMSDHGMRFFHTYFHINNWLEDKGYLRVNSMNFNAVEKIQNVVIYNKITKYLYNKYNKYFNFILNTKYFDKLITKTRKNIQLTSMKKNILNVMAPLEFWQYLDWDHTKAVMIGDGLIVLNPNNADTVFRNNLQNELNNLTHNEQNVLVVKNVDELYNQKVTKFDLAIIPGTGFSPFFCYKQNCNGNYYTKITKVKNERLAEHDMYGIYLLYDGKSKNYGVEFEHNIFDISRTILSFFDI